MSLILYHDENQKRIAEISLKKEEHKYNNKLVTEIAPAGAFYPAEEYENSNYIQRCYYYLVVFQLSPKI